MTTQGKQTQNTRTHDNTRETNTKPKTTQHKVNKHKTQEHMTTQGKQTQNPRQHNTELLTQKLFLYHTCLSQDTRHMPTRLSSQKANKHTKQTNLGRSEKCP